jgi:hypothetical protein
MSSRGEMKISLKLMIWAALGSASGGSYCMPTFSCRRCFKSFSSRYVRFDRTGVLKGFMIFLIATAWLVSWSFAELCPNQYPASPEARSPYQTRPKAPMPTGCRSVYLRRVSFARHRNGVCSHLLVISKVVPKICALTNLSVRASV